MISQGGNERKGKERKRDERIVFFLVMVVWMLMKKGNETNGLVFDIGDIIEAFLENFLF